MMTYAKMNNTDLLLIAGDVFDAEYVTRETVSLLCREFENYKNPVFISPGNHDPASEKSIWMRDIFPPNVHVFKTEEPERVSLRLHFPRDDGCSGSFTHCRGQGED